MNSSNSPETEDTLSFTSAILGALGSTLQQQNSSKTLLLSLVLAAVAKAIPSLSDPHKKASRLEDSILVAASLLGALSAGIESNFSFSDPLSQQILVAGLVIGLAGKAIPSLVKNPKSYEDLFPLGLAILSAVAIILSNTQFATFGLFLGFLAKQLVSSSGDGKH